RIPGADVAGPAIAPGAPDPAAEAGAILHTRQVGRLALRHPDRDDGLLGVASGDLADEPRRRVVAGRPFRSRGRSVIEGPATLVVPAAARRGPGLEVVQEHSRPGARQVAEERLQPLAMGGEGRGVADRYPGPRLDDLTVFRPRGGGEPSSPVVMMAA